MNPHKLKKIALGIVVAKCCCVQINAITSNLQKTSINGILKTEPKDVDAYININTVLNTLDMLKPNNNIAILTAISVPNFFDKGKISLINYWIEEIQHHCEMNVSENNIMRAGINTYVNQLLKKIDSGILNDSPNVNYGNILVELRKIQNYYESYVLKQVTKNEE